MTDPQKITWERFTEAYRRISDAERLCHRSGSAHALERADAFETAREELHDAFQHRHVRSDDGDKCGLCGLDLRNEIHIRDN